MTVTKLERAQQQEALALVWRVFLEYEAPDYPPQGVEAFRKSVFSEEYLSQLTMYGAYVGGELAGVIAARSGGAHVALFFVETRFQRQGVGRALFERLLADSPRGALTVTSSPYAVGVYRALGFRETAGEQSADGIRFTPMEYVKVTSKNHRLKP